MNNMFFDTSSLTNLDMRNAAFDHSPISDEIFFYVPSSARVITENNTTKTWLQSVYFYGIF